MVARLAPECAKGAQGDPNTAAVPVTAVSVGNKAELVYTSYEGAKEEKINEGNERGGAFCG